MRAEEQPVERAERSAGGARESARAGRWASSVSTSIRGGRVCPKPGVCRPTSSGRAGELAAKGQPAASGLAAASASACGHPGSGGLGARRGPSAGATSLLGPRAAQPGWLPCCGPASAVPDPLCFPPGLPEQRCSGPKPGQGARPSRTQRMVRKHYKGS